MSAPTHFLSALVLVCVAFPTQLFRIGLMALSPTTRSAQWFRRLGLGGFSAVVAALAWYLAPLEGLPLLPQWLPWLAVAVAVGVAAPAWEIGLGYVVGAIGGRKFGGVALHEHWPGGSAAVTVAAVVIAVAEEIIFRGIGIGLLTGPLGWHVLTAVIVTAGVYGLNHLYFGWLTVAQKTVSGVVFAILFIIGGGLLVPVIAHVVQNLVVLTVLPRLSIGGKAVSR